VRKKKSHIFSKLTKLNLNITVQWCHSF